jgi:hypothetical protein
VILRLWRAFNSPLRRGLRSRTPDLVQRGEESVNFFSRVVVHKADAQHAAAGLDAQPLAQIKRVVVPVPGEQSALTKMTGQLARSVAGNANRNSRHALRKACRFFDAIEREARNGRRPLMSRSAKPRS